MFLGAKKQDRVEKVIWNVFGFVEWTKIPRNVKIWEGKSRKHKKEIIHVPRIIIKTARAFSRASFKLGWLEVTEDVFHLVKMNCNRIVGEKLLPWNWVKALQELCRRSITAGVDPEVKWLIASKLVMKKLLQHIHLNWVIVVIDTKHIRTMFATYYILCGKCAKREHTSV